MAKTSLTHEFTKGIIKENPVLCLLLGTCPTLAVTTGATNAIGMGIAATLVLVASNAVISLLRRLIPDTIRIPAYITIIAGFVTIVQLLVKAYLPAIDEALGIFSCPHRRQLHYSRQPKCSQTRIPYCLPL
jgi:electron transport complex protein RnfE